MDYTKNYHLPQWDKNDRIMMEDFNQMCASIEEGISQNSAAAEQLAGQINRNAASAGTALKRGLFRNAYNRYHAAAALKTLPRQVGFFHQKLTPEVQGSEDVVGFLAKGSGALWLANSGKTLGGANIEDYCTVSSKLAVTSSGTTPMVFEFNAPGAGYFSQILLSCGSATISQESDLRFRITLRNLSTGKDDVDREVTVRYNNELPYYIWIREKIYFHQAKYRVTITPISTHYSGTYGITPYGYTEKSAAGTLRRSVEVGETSADGFVSLVYDGYGGAAVQLQWDGAALSPYTTYSYTDTAGRPVQETIWRRGGEVPTSTSLLLSCNCPAGGDLTVYNWGMMLI